MFNGKIHYEWSFSIAMLVYQRVGLTTHKPPHDSVRQPEVPRLCLGAGALVLSSASAPKQIASEDPPVQVIQDGAPQL